MEANFMSVQQVADFLKVSEGTIIRLLKSGEMEGHKVGGQWRLTRNQVDEYLEKQKNTAQN